MSQLPITEFADRLNVLMSQLMREYSHRQPDEITKGKITLPQFLILDFLHKEGEAKMTDLAHTMKVTTAAMTGIVERLVKYRYVSRELDLSDRRIIKIKMTPAGSELVKRISQQKRRMTIDIFEKISPEDREKYLEILTHILDTLATEEADG